MWKFDGSRLPTDTERKNLSRLYLAFVDMRALILDGDPRPAKDLAGAFHNIPLMMHTPDFSFSAFREFLGNYQTRYQAHLRINYLQEWDKLNATT